MSNTSCLNAYSIISEFSDSLANFGHVVTGTLEPAGPSLRKLIQFDQLTFDS